MESSRLKLVGSRKGGEDIAPPEGAQVIAGPQFSALD